VNATDNLLFDSGVTDPDHWSDQSSYTTPLVSVTAPCGKSHIVIEITPGVGRIRYAPMEINVALDEDDGACDA
jgi:hypothetical protein